jgi:4-amino-4-deoxy-L-arabinose transferase-like glycosyltransferase
MTLPGARGRWTALQADRRAGLLLAAFFVLLYFAALGSVPLLSPDEGRYTEIPREMLQRGDFVLPHLNGVLYFEKPALYYWLNALAIQVFGLTPFASRFWSALFGLAGLWVAYRLALKTQGARTARLAVLILGTSPLYLALSRLAIIDMTVSFFITATLACFYLASEESDPRRERLLWHACAASAALAVLAKGLIGLALPGLVAFLYMLWGRRWAILRRFPWVSGTALLLLIALPWHVAAALRDPQFFRFYIIREHFLRYLTPIADRMEPFWFFLPVLVWGLLPWTPFAVQALAEGLGRRPGTRLFGQATPDLFLWLWAAVILVFFSASKSKLVPYILPALPPLAILSAGPLARVQEEGRGLKPWVRWSAALALCAILALSVLLGMAALGLGPGARRALFHPGWILAASSAALLVSLGVAVKTLRADARNVVPALAAGGCALFIMVWSAAPNFGHAQELKEIAGFLSANLRPADRLYSYRTYPQAIPVYLQRTIGVAVFRGELAFGAGRLSEEERKARFPDAAEFRVLWDSPERIFCITDESGLTHLQEDGIAHAYTILRVGRMALMTNQPWDSGAGD